MNEPNIFANLYSTADEQARYELDERASILENDAGFTREIAEAMTAIEFLKLNLAEVSSDGNDISLLFTATNA